MEKSTGLRIRELSKFLFYLFFASNHMSELLDDVEVVGDDSMEGKALRSVLCIEWMMSDDSMNLGE